MKKKILGVMMIATMAGGIFAGTNVAPVKSGRISGNDCI